MYDTMDLIVPILIIAAIAVIILAFFKSMKEINDNKKAPLLSVPAKVSGKRTDIIKRKSAKCRRSVWGTWLYCGDEYYILCVF